MTRVHQDDVIEPLTLPPSLERIVARALSRPAAATRNGWSDAAKRRLYARMFPDHSAPMPVPDAKPAA